MWDTAGQEQFKSLCPIYFRGSSGCVCVFDVTNRMSFEDVEDWLEIFKKAANPNSPILIVGNKIDKPNETWKVTLKDIETLCEFHGCEYVLTSGKEGWNADIMDEKMRKMCHEIENKIPEYEIKREIIVKEEKCGCM